MPDIATEQFQQLLDLMRKQIDQNGRAQETWRKETLETRDVQRQLVTAIVDLRSELEFWRTRPDRDARLDEIERTLSNLQQAVAIGG
jgi:hypothetical protein